MDGAALLAAHGEDRFGADDHDGAGRSWQQQSSRSQQLTRTPESTMHPHSAQPILITGSVARPGREIMRPGQTGSLRG
jgi:hypothetical protein